MSYGYGKIYTMTNLFKTVIFILLCIAGNFSFGQSLNYRYSLLRRVSNDEHLIHYISYRNTVIEFELRQKKITKIRLQTSSQTESYSYDTVGIRIIDINKDICIQISAFSEKFKVIKKGKYDTAPFNFRPTMGSLMNLDIKLMKDTMVGNYKYSYDFSKVKKENGSDSILTKFYFLKGQKFLSVFKRNRVDRIFKNKDVDLVGLEFKFIDADEGVLFLITDLYPLDKATELVCGKILNKIK